MQPIYWIVDGFKTQSKIAAIMQARGDLNKIKFYFFDEEWSEKDFTHEPSGSFSDLAIARCKDIRNRADWVALWLSSGYDSTTVLRYFELSKQPIDEIFIFKRLTSHDTEYKTSLEIANRYRTHHNTNVKITFLPLNKDYLYSIYNELKSNFIFGPGPSLRLSKSPCNWLINYNHDVLRLIEKKFHKRVDLTGFDKPRVLLHNNKWYSFMPDSAVMDFVDHRLTGFYLDVFSFELHLKQTYMVIDWFESLENFNPDLVHKIQNHDSFFYAAWNEACGRIPVQNDYSIRGLGKNYYTNSINSPDMAELIKIYGDSHIMKFYNEGIRTFKSVAEWWDEKTDLNSKININSEMRFIRDYEKKK